MNTLEIRIIAYAVFSLGVISATAWATHKLDSAHYESLHAEYADYRAQVSKDNADAQKAARDALQTQIDAHQRTETNNAQIIASMQSQADGARHDAEFARKLLAIAANAGAAPAGHPVPKAGGGSGTDGASGAPGDRPLAEDLGLAAGECRVAIQRLAGLQAELIPQL